VQRIRADLPGEMRDPVISKLDVAGTPILAYAIASKTRDDEALSWFVDDTVTRRLLAVRGVGAVARVGGVSREVSILIDPLKLKSLGVTAAEVTRALRQMQLESAGGRAEIGAGEQPLRTLGTVASAAELAQIELPLAGRRVRLDQLASVRDAHAEPRSLALHNGKPVVAFEVTRSRGAGEVEVGDGVQAALKELLVAHPDLTITETFNLVQPVREEFQGSMVLLLEGALLAILVVFLFLRDFRATVVSAVALPLSVIPAFIGMDLFGFSINVVTLLALSLVVGVLVDDAIVEVENIMRHLRMGKTPFQAAMEAADEIGLAVIATTFTLVAVFLPTAFMSGIPGRFFKQFGWSTALAVMASLLVARMLTPMMAAYLLKAVPHKTEDGRMMKAYLILVQASLAHRWITMLVAVLFFAGSVALIPFLPTGFIPPDDMSQTLVRLELPPGATLRQTRDAAEDARQLVAKLDHVKSVYTTVGGGSAGNDPFLPPTANEVRKATLTLNLAARNERPVSKQVIEARIREAMTALPGVRYQVGFGGVGEKYVLVLSGDDGDALARVAGDVERDLRTIPGIGAITSSAALVRPEIAVKPDFARAADLGVNSAAIGDTLRIATLGDYDSALPKLNLSSRQVPIVARLDPAARTDLETLARLDVPGARGPVMLNQVATLSWASGPAVINRHNRSRNVTFDIELSGTPLGEVTAAAQALPSLKNLPPGVRQVELGDAEMMGEMMESFGMAMAIGVVCILSVLVLLFKGIMQPLTILFALPLSFGGAFVALLLTGKALSMPSLIGLVMMMGIATKNSILLVEYAIVARAQGMVRRRDALIDACHKRARPIIMTTIAMGAGMLPTAIGMGVSDPSFRSPMAIAVIGGLITSTLLSLVVIPVVYTFADDVEHLFSRKSRKAGEAGTV
jgi:multidrug efflux pump subunit AcrB